jgi:HPt (histidine-containing phosphotransfer) domain-containing protein
MLDLGRALGRLQGDRALLRRIATQFAGGAPEARAKLHAAFERRDASVVAFASHHLRGQASLFGGEALTMATDTLEEAARQEGWSAAASALATVDRELDRLLHALAASFEGE